MTKVKVDAIVKDSKVQSGKTAKSTTDDKLKSAKVMESINEDSKSELVKLIARAEDSARKDLVSEYYKFVVKHTFAELRKFATRYRKICDEDVARIDGVLLAIGSFKRVFKSGARYYYLGESSDKALFNEAKKVAYRLREGRKFTAEFTKIPTSSDGVVSFKDVVDIHGAFMSMQRSVTAIKAEEIKAAYLKKKEEEEKENETARILAKVQDGTATKEELQKYVLLMAGVK